MNLESGEGGEVGESLFGNVCPTPTPPTTTFLSFTTFTTFINTRLISSHSRHSSLLYIQEYSRILNCQEYPILNTTHYSIPIPILPILPIPIPPPISI